MEINLDNIAETHREREIYQKGKIELDQENFNKYASHKSVSQNLLNTSVMQSHIGTLIFILSESDDNKGFEIAAIILISFSLFIQLIIFFSLTWLLYHRQDENSSIISPAGVNIAVTCLSGIALIINISITAISLEIRRVV
jgi:hypothetical protein